MNHLPILDARRVTESKFHAENPQILGATVQKSVTTATWHPAFCAPLPDTFALTLYPSVVRVWAI